MILCLERYAREKCRILLTRNDYAYCAPTLMLIYRYSMVAVPRWLNGMGF